MPTKSHNRKIKSKGPMSRSLSSLVLVVLIDRCLLSPSTSLSSLLPLLRWLFWRDMEWIELLLCPNILDRISKPFFCSSIDNAHWPNRLIIPFGNRSLQYSSAFGFWMEDPPPLYFLCLLFLEKRRWDICIRFESECIIDLEMNER